MRAERDDALHSRRSIFLKNLEGRFFEVLRGPTSPFDEKEIQNNIKYCHAHLFPHIGKKTALSDLYSMMSEDKELRGKLMPFFSEILLSEQRLAEERKRNFLPKDKCFEGPINRLLDLKIKNDVSYKKAIISLFLRKIAGKESRVLKPGFRVVNMGISFKDRIYLKFSESCLVLPNRGNSFTVYVFSESLGQGSYGEVIAISSVFTLDITEHVVFYSDEMAVKKINMPPKEMKSAKTICQKAETEAKMASEFGLGAQWIEPLYGDACAGFMLMRRMPGVNLSQQRPRIEGIFRENEKNGTNLLFTISLKLIKALMAIHAKGIVHRDIKSGNVMLSDQLQVNIIDFGFAKALKDKPTLSGGTRPYRAPELRENILNKGKALYTPAADVYALAVTIAETWLLCFQPRNSSEWREIKHNSEKNRTCFFVFSGEMVGDIKEILSPALSHDPLERPSLAELKAEFKRARDRFNESKGVQSESSFEASSSFSP